MHYKNVEVKSKKQNIGEKVVPGADHVGNSILKHSEMRSLKVLLALAVILAAGVGRCASPTTRTGRMRKKSSNSTSRPWPAIKEKVADKVRAAARDATCTSGPGVRLLLARCIQMCRPMFCDGHRLGGCVCLLIGTVVLFGCGTRRTGREEDPLSRNIVFDAQAQAPLVPERIARISYLPLETNEQTLFAQISKLAFNGDWIYVGDYSSGKILAFDASGRSKLVLDAQGRGPGEYLGITSFAVDENHLFVLDNSMRKLLTYDARTGEYLSGQKAPVIAFDMETLSNGGFVFAFAPTVGGALNTSQPHYRIFITDCTGDIQEKLFEYEDDETDLIGYLRYFSAHGDSLVFGSVRDDGYHVLSREDGRLLETVRFDFRKHRIPDDKRNDINALSQYYVVPTVPFICGRLTQFQVVMPETSFGGGTFLFDSETEKILSHPQEVSGNFLYNLVGSHEDAFVGFVQGRDTYEGLLAQGFTRADPATEAAILRDEPALIFYHMR